jgi:serine/threonine protein kinase
MVCSSPSSSEPGRRQPRASSVSSVRRRAWPGDESELRAGAEPADAVAQGSVLAGKYRVERMLGTGGMGVVVAATHVESGEHVAIKYLKPWGLNSAEALARFDREACAALRVTNEHVARTLEVGRLQDAAPYLAMECLEGVDLGRYLEQEGPLAPELACLLALQICEALAAAHAVGIIHRDIKPRNLFVTQAPDGSPHVKLLDFGISKLVAAAGEPPLTQPRMALGSPPYMSPEQMLSTRDVDCRTDIWSLGVVLYKMLTGRSPFQAGSAQELRAMLIEGTVLPVQFVPGELPEALEAVVKRCLERSPGHRFSNVGELAQALQPFAGPKGVAYAERAAEILGQSAMEDTVKLTDP